MKRTSLVMALALLGAALGALVLGGVANADSGEPPRVDVSANRGW